MRALWSFQFGMVTRPEEENRPDEQQLMGNIHHPCTILENPRDYLHHVFNKTLVDNSLKGNGDLFQLFRRLAQMAAVLEHGGVLEHANHLFQFV